MGLNRKMMAVGVAVFALLGTVGVATAAPAYVTTNVNVRSGPGTGYAVIDSLRRGEQVDVQQCRGSWCYVEKRGPDGWVSANYLDRGGRPGWNDDNYGRPPYWNNPRPPRPPQWNNPRPPYWGNPRPPRPPHWDYPRPPRPDYGGRRDACDDVPPGFFGCR